MLPRPCEGRPSDSEGVPTCPSGARSFGETQNGRTWLLSIAAGTCLEASGRHGLQRLGIEQVWPDDGRPDPTDARSVAAMLAGLKPKRRLAFVLTQVLRMPYPEAAEVCGCAPATIATRVAQSRTDLIGAPWKPMAARARLGTDPGGGSAGCSRRPPGARPSSGDDHCRRADRLTMVTPGCSGSLELDDCQLTASGVVHHHSDDASQGTPSHSPSRAAPAVSSAPQGRSGCRTTATAAGTRGRQPHSFHPPATTATTWRTTRSTWRSTSSDLSHLPHSVEAVSRPGNAPSRDDPACIPSSGAYRPVPPRPARCPRPGLSRTRRYQPAPGKRSVDIC